MKAALLEAPGRPLAIVDDLELEAPRAGFVRVRVTHCGICHSDLSVADGKFPSPLPIVLGHEAAGIVDQLGEGVTGLSRGDHVVLTPVPPCGTCYWCVRSQPALCVNTVGLMSSALPDGRTGLSRRGKPVYRGLNLAAFAEYTVVHATGAVKIPAEVPLDVACVVGCAVQTGAGAVLNAARVVEGATVLVLGLGGIGLSAVPGARLAGAVRILASDPVPARREVAKRFGATDLLDPTHEDVVARARELTGGIGVDYAFETAGIAALVPMGLAATRNGGTTVAVGAPPIDQTIDLGPGAIFAVSAKTLMGTILGHSNSLLEIPRLVGLWQSGRLDLEGLITARRPLAEVNEAMDDLRASRGIRTVLAL